jgi:hypothetical protein
MRITEFLASPFLLMRYWRNVPENDAGWFKYLLSDYLASALYVVLGAILLFLVTT